MTAASAPQANMPLPFSTGMPVERIDTGSDADFGLPAPGVGLCLSGGGFRAMLFHLGAIWRLNELGYLPKLDRISSVSGGSITAGMLAMKWNRLRFGPDGCAENYIEEVVQPIRAMANRTVDIPAILGGLLVPVWISRRVIASYKQYLFGNTSLKDLPDHPGFVLMPPIFNPGPCGVLQNDIWRTTGWGKF